MGVYLDWFAFEVPNKHPLLELIIEPAFAVRSVCFQVHKSSGNVYKAFWNYEITSREMPKLIHEYINYRPDVKNWMLGQLLDDPEFAKYIKKYTPINCRDLGASDMNIINDVINVDFGESRFVAPGGLDGHSYTLKIYEKEYKEYHCWCVIPAEWKELIPLVDMVINIAELNPRERYAVFGTKDNLL